MKNLLIIGILLSLNWTAITQIQLLNDEFDNSSSLCDWLNIDDIEGWNADHLEELDINITQPVK